MRDARKSPGRLTPGNEALAFAIYFSAIVSLEPDEVLANFGLTKEELIRSYRFALEQALARANFLHASDLVVLQAFTLFLITVRRVDDSRFCWTLTGLVIRIAKGMGLHRDGTQFDSTPFETEMRRRLWWAMMILDLRSSEELGTELTIAEGSFDTRKPLNIDDVDIGPSSTEFPQPKPGRSDMAAILARCEIAGLARRNLQNCYGSAPIMNHDEVERSLIGIYRNIEDKFKHSILDEGDSLYWTVIMIARLIVAKMCLHLYQNRMFANMDEDLPVGTRERVYLAAIEVVEISHQLRTDLRFKQFRWLFMTYTSWHAIAFNLIQVCRRPWSALSERSLEAATAFERDPVELAKMVDHGAIFLPLRKLFARARKHRASELTRLCGNVEEASRLDLEDRRIEASTRFGPLPGADSHVKELREKWWCLVNPDGPRPPSPAEPTPAPSLFTDDAHITSGDDGTMGRSNIPNPRFTNETMEMIDDMMSLPTNPVMTSFLALNMPAEVRSLEASGLHAHGSMMSPTAPLSHRETSLRQQALALQAQAASRESHDLPPHLWSNPFGEPVAPPEEKDAAMEMDMLDGDFDWQDWGQSLQNFDLLGMQGPAL